MARRRPKARRYSFETLEDRRLMAGDVSAKISHGNLVIKGDKLDNAITIAVSGGQISVSGDTGTGTNINGLTTPFTTAATNFTGKLKIDMGKGNDSVTIHDLTVDGKAKLELGKGNDTLIWDNTDVTGKTKIKTGKGNDNATITNSTFSELDVSMGKGNDNLAIAGTTSSETDLDGGRGTNVLTQGTGNSLGDLDIDDFTVNTAPTVDLLTVDPINENSAATLKGTITDPDVADAHSVTVDWKDPNNSAGSTFAVPATNTLAVNNTFTSTGADTTTTLKITSIDLTTGKVGFEINHTYLDDGQAPGNATTSDDSVVTVTVKDSSSLPGTDTTTITVKNVVPTITDPPDTAVTENSEVTLVTTVTDPGTLDVFSAAVNWGDGAADDTIGNLGTSNVAETTVGGTKFTWNATTRQLTYKHTYLDDNPTGTPFDDKTVTVKVHDDDDTTNATQTTTVRVNNAVPTVTITGAPTTSPEGTAITLGSTITDPGSADTQTRLWSVTKNGSAFTVTNNTSANFTFTPDDNGTYVVTLTATDDDGGVGTDSKTITVTNVNPTAAINGAPATSPEGTQINLTSTVTDPGTADTFTFAWSVTKNGNAFGAGGTNANFSFTPDDNGTYVVSLTVTDDDGGVGTATPKTITVTNVNPAPTINGAPATSPEGTQINLTSSPNDPGTADTFTFTWSVTKNGNAFGAGGTNANFSFTPDDNGTYVVSLTVTDDDGGVGTAPTKTITVTNVNPVATINGAPASSPESTQIDLTSTVTDPGTADTFTYAWSVTKNGAAYDSGTNANFSFTPNDNGTYVVSLTVTDDDGGVGTATPKTITVTNVNPVATINGAPTTSPEGTQIDLTSTVTDVGTLDTTFTYAWSVTKNGNPYDSGTNANFSFTPDDNGTYIVSLSATDKDGGVGTATPKTITVTNVDPTAAINGAPATSPEGTQIDLTSTVTDPGTADTFTYAWSVTKNGAAYDDVTSADPNFSFTPNDNGTYVVSLTVTDDDGGVGTATDKTITVTNVNPAPTINGAPATSPEGTQINLTSSPNDPGSADTFTYAWSVTKNGDAFGAGGTNANFSFTPDDNGTYVVSLTVTDDDGGVGTATDKTITVTNVNPVATINGAPSSSPESTQIDLTSTVTDAGTADTVASYAWSVTKNGNPYDSGTNANFSFTPDDNGTYVVSLSVTDDDGGVGTDSKTINVTNVNPVATINGAPATSPEGTQIDLTSTVTDVGTLDTTFTYAWSVTKNGNPYDSGTNANFSFTPDDNGTYVVSFTATDKDGGIGTATPKTITVTNVDPTAAINGAPATSPEGTQIDLTSTVTDPGTADTFTYAWSVTKNGNPYDSGTNANFSFTPDDNGTYVVSLTVTDDDGSVGTATDQTITVTNVPPENLAIAGAPTTSPEGTAINVGIFGDDPGSADTFTYAWSVTKNGNPYSTGPNDIFFGFTPDDNGTYVISLSITDDDGGVGTAPDATITVTNANPAPTINGAPATSPEGTQIDLTSTVTDPGSADTVASYAWSVTKNGNPYDSGTNANFSFTPNDNGTYVVSLTVTDDDGGIGTAPTKTISVTNVGPQNLAISGAPATGTVGTLISLGNSFDDPGSADTFSYAWSVTKDGNPFDSGTNSSFNFTPNAAGTYVVGLTVTDDDGGVANAPTKTITV